jgi:hypothetical protein
MWSIFSHNNRGGNNPPSPDWLVVLAIMVTIFLVSLNQGFANPKQFRVKIELPGIMLQFDGNIERQIDGNIEPQPLPPGTDQDQLNSH